MRSGVLNAAPTVRIVLSECGQVHVDLIIRDLVALHREVLKMHPDGNDHNLSPYLLRARGLSD